MGQLNHQIANAERDLRRARHILGVGTGYTDEEWALLAALVGEADRVVRDAALEDACALVPLRDEVVKELQDATAGFTDPGFLRAARSARRRNPRAFVRNV